MKSVPRGDGMDHIETERRVRVVLTSLFFALAILGAPAAFAQTSAAEEEPGDAESGSEISEEEYQELSEDSVPVERPSYHPGMVLDPREYTLFWNQGLRFERRDGWFTSKLGARVEGDFASIHGDSGVRREIGGLGEFVEVRRAWLTLSGTLGKRIIFKAQVDVTGESAGNDDRNPYLREIFLGMTGLGPFGTVKFGFHKEPFSSNELTSSLSIPFMERSLIAAFSPSYNLGISSQNQAFDKRLAWSYGLFHFSGEGGDLEERLDLAGRISGLPLYAEDGRRLIHLGASYSHQFRDDFDLSYGRGPESHLAENFVSTGEFPADDVDLFGLEIATQIGPLIVQSEFNVSRVERSGASDPTFWGGMAQVRYMVTGEHRRYIRSRGLFGRVVPSRALDFRECGWGALEVAVRFSYLDLDSGGVEGGTLRDLTVGANWYPFPHVRFMANYVHAYRKSVGDADIFQMRLGIDF